MNYLSVCSGIEAATVAWHNLDFKPIAFSEIEAFPSAVLKYHYPDVLNFGDMTKYKEWNIGRETVDLIVGGTPCQSFSIAGLRKGLDDPRGNLMLTYLGLVDHFKPRWIVWENVSGVLSSNKGKDFGTFIGALAELGYGFCYRVLDAQFFGVPQRRRRVFVVGYFGDWRPAAAVLFEPESLRRDIKKSRKKGEGITASIENSIREYYESHPNDSRVTGPHEIANTVSARSETGGGNTPLITEQDQIGFRMVAFGEYKQDNSASTVKQRDYKDSTDLVLVPENPISIQGNMIGRAADAGPNGKGFNEDNVSFTLTKTDIHAVCIPINDKATRCNNGGDTRNNDGAGNGLGVGKDGDPSPTPTRGDRHNVCYSVDCRNLCENEEISSTLQSKNNGGYSLNYINPVKINSIVRRLTPKECERLQGFPDNWTKIPWRNKPVEDCPDGPRYKAIGNSMAIPCMRWIGRRIKLMEEILEK